MTLRDTFALAALPILLADDDVKKRVVETGVNFFRLVALGAYEIADAMLAEREYK